MNKKIKPVVQSKSSRVESWSIPKKKYTENEKM